MEDKENLISNFINENINEIPNTLNLKLTSNNGKYSHRTEYYTIREYIDSFLEDKTNNRFIVLPGLRGVGKTTILYQIYEYLLKEKDIPLNQILYISCEDLESLIECSIRELTEIFLKNYHNTTLRLLDKKIFLLIDESQYDDNWALSGKIIFDRTENIFMIFTGSSALNLEYNADAARRLTKKEITPLTYSHHIKLKYGINIDNKHEKLLNMLFTGNIIDIQEEEEKIKNTLLNNIQYEDTDWNNYLYYGGYPVYFDESNSTEIRDKLVDMTRRIISTDMLKIKNISITNQTHANRILRYLALQESSDVSMNKLSKYLNTPVGNINNILNILEKTHLIYHLQPHGTSSKRTRKAWKYYFATSSIKHALASKNGIIIKNREQYEGILLENMIASKLHELSDNNQRFTLYYDSNKKNVDFLLQQEFGKPIPIEVGRGKKDKKQVREAIKNYDAEHGIIISNKTKSVVKDEDVIYIPPKTFTLL